MTAFVAVGVTFTISIQTTQSTVLQE